MSWKAVARKDFHDAIRSRTFLVLSVLFGLFSVGIATLFGYFTEELASGMASEDLAIGLISFVSIPVSLFVTLVGVIICHKSIVGERESGTLKLLLSLPHTRRDIVLGKIVGRTGVLAVPALTSLLLGIAVGSIMIGSVAVVPTALLFLGILFLCVTYVSLVVGLSAVTSSEGVATAVAVGYYIVFELLWSSVLGVVQVLVIDGNPDWMYPLIQIPASSAFSEILNTGIVATTDAVGEDILLSNTYDAFYASPLTSLLILLFWLTVPAYLGYRRFAATDL